jgi:hypothetical protein
MRILTEASVFRITRPGLYLDRWRQHHPDPAIAALAARGRIEVKAQASEQDPIMLGACGRLAPCCSRYGVLVESANLGRMARLAAWLDSGFGEASAQVAATTS